MAHWPLTKWFKSIDWMTNLQEILVLVDSYRFDHPYFTYISHIQMYSTQIAIICFFVSGLANNFTPSAFPTMNSLWTVILVLSTPFSIITGPTWTYKDWLIQNLFYQMLVSSLQTGKDWQTPQSWRGRYVSLRFFHFKIVCIQILWTPSISIFEY